MCLRAMGAGDDLPLAVALVGEPGIGSKVRRAGAAGERARITAQRRLREAIRKIAEVDAELGEHLDQAVRTGTFCAYRP